MTTIVATEFLPLVATVGAARDALIVSLHDVAPSTQEATAQGAIIVRRGLVNRRMAVSAGRKGASLVT